MLTNRILHPLSILLAIFFFASLTSSAARASGPGGIIEPLNGAVVQGGIHIIAVADDPNFAAWQLDLLPNADDKRAIFIARDTTPSATRSNLKKVDTLLYPNGAYMLRLRIVKNDGNYDEYAAAITIHNTAPTPENSITAPENGAVVKCTVEVKGYANDPIFRKWQLDLLPAGNEAGAIYLNRGSSIDGTERNFTLLDTRAYPDGAYLLRLRVVGQDGQYDSYYSWLTIDNSALTDACNCASPNDIVPAGPNGIATPLDGSTVAGKFLVCGIADDPGFATWQLDLLFGGDPKQAILIARGKSPNKTSAPLTQLDASVLPDGKYGLRLSVSRMDLSYDEHTNFIYVANSAPDSQGQPVK